MDAEEIDVEEEDMEVEEVVEEEEEEEEEDPEEEEVIEEEEEEVIEEEEEEEVIEEEEEEQENEDVEESSDSLCKPSDLPKDVERDHESGRLDRRLGSCSSRTEELKSCPELNSESQGMKPTSPPDEQSTTVKDTCLSFENSVKEPTLTENKGTREAWEDGKDSELPTGDSRLNDKPRQDTTELVSRGNTGISNTAGVKTCGPSPSNGGVGQKLNGACDYGNKRSNVKSEDEKSGTDTCNPAGDKVSDSGPAGADMFQKSDDACSSGKGRSNIKLEDGNSGLKSRSRSFSPGGEIKEPQQKRAGIVCDFFAKGWCIRGKSCRFLHVKDNLNNASQRQAGNSVAGNNEIRSGEERTTLNNRVSGKACEAKENSEVSLHSREKRSLDNSQASQRVFSYKEDTGFMWSSKDMGRERLKQNVGADGPENGSVFFNDGNPSILRSSFVHGHRSSVSSSSKLDIAPSQPAWTGSFHMSVSASGGQRQFESGNKFYGSESVSSLQGFPASSHQDPEGNTAHKKAKVPSNDWEPSEPFRPSFVIPPSILPPCSTPYENPFLDGMDAQKLEDNLHNDSVSSKGVHAQSTSRHHKGGDSASGPQAKDCNDDKNSSCSQNQYQEAAPEKNSEVHGVEMVATSVVEQNEVNPKKGNSSEPAHRKDVLERSSRPAVGYDAWQKSNMSSNIKILRTGDDADGEVRSDAGMKVMRNFRTALIETIKELLKPMWREGRLSKDVHNMIVKKAVEKVISTAVQFHQVPADTESIGQYLSMSRSKILKLVEGYVEKFRKP